MIPQRSQLQLPPPAEKTAIDLAPPVQQLTPSDTAVRPLVRVKPALRGVSHEIAFLVSPILFGALIYRTHGARNLACATIYGLSVVILFGASALYHRPNWRPKTRDLLGRVDLCSIYLAMAGGYTPIFILGVGGERGVLLLWMVWIAVALGIARVLYMPNAPKFVHALFYIPIGWIGVVSLPDIFHNFGLARVTTLTVGGVLLTAGALVYGFERPDPWPRTFGYHEVYHLLVIVGLAFHFHALASVICQAA